MSTVFRAMHPILQQARAIKLLSPRLAADPAFLARFQREAKMAAGLRHPNIVLIYDVAQQDDLHYIVMDLVAGQTLGRLAGAQRALPLSRAVALLRQLAAALDFAHSREVVHRDIKPNNVIVGPNDHLTLLDFGIAHAAQESHLTRAGTVLGTPEYMAPEVLAGRDSGPSSDRYALGVVAYELLTGQVPFKGTAGLVARARVNSPLGAPSSLRPDLPTRLDEILLRQLATDPAERYPSSQEFVAALASPPAASATALDDHPTVTIPRPAPVPSTPGTTLPPSGPEPGSDDRETLTIEQPVAASASHWPKRLLPYAVALGALLVAMLFASNRLAAPSDLDPAVGGTRAGETPNAGVPAPTAGGAAKPAVAATATSQPALTSSTASAPIAEAFPPAPSPTGASATVASSPASGGPPSRTILEEHFATNERGWPDDRRGRAWFDGDGYHLFGRDPGRFVALGAPLGRTLGDVTVSGTFRKVGGPPGGGYGLILRDQGPDRRDGLSQGGRYYVFEAGDKGEFGIWRREVDRWADIIPWTPTPAIRPDRSRNDLTVEAIGPRFTFLINGVRVASVESLLLSPGGVGIYLGGDLNEVVVEELRVQVGE